MSSARLGSLRLAATALCAAALFQPPPVADYEATGNPGWQEPIDVAEIDSTFAPPMRKLDWEHWGFDLYLADLDEVDGRAQLRFYLETRYRDYVEPAEVFVTVIESRSKKIYLLGKVNTPGEYLLQKHMTVVQAISLAGGLAEWADQGDIKLIRKINGMAQTYRVDYDAIVSGEDPSQNVQLQPDDTIFVP